MTPSGLVAICTVSSVLAPTATKSEPFQAIPRTTLNGFSTEVHENPSGLVTIVDEPYPPAT